MARDYSARPSRRSTGDTAGNSRPRQAGRRAPAARRKRARPAKKGGPPGWLWLACGLCIGLTIAAGLYIARPAGGGARQRIDIATPGTSADTADTAGAPDDAGGAAGKRSRPKPRFAFYKMLPDYQVAIPKGNDKAGSGGGHDNVSAGEPGHDHGAQPAAQSQAKASPEPESGGYVIQAGSFSTVADADQRKAELALLGVSAEISDVDLDSGKTVYRVHSETIDSSDNVDRLVRRLHKNQIDTLVTRAK